MVRIEIFRVRELSDLQRNIRHRNDPTGLHLPFLNLERKRPRRLSSTCESWKSSPLSFKRRVPDPKLERFQLLLVCESLPMSSSSSSATRKTVERFPSLSTRVRFRVSSLSHTGVEYKTLRFEWSQQPILVTASLALQRIRPSQQTTSHET